MVAKLFERNTNSAPAAPTTGKDLKKRGKKLFSKGGNVVRTPPPHGASDIGGECRLSRGSHSHGGGNAETKKRKTDVPSRALL